MLLEAFPYVFRIVSLGCFGPCLPATMFEVSLDKSMISVHSTYKYTPPSQYLNSQPWCVPKMGDTFSLNLRMHPTP